MRAARGSPLPRLPLPWKSVGSDTGCEMRDAGCVETAPARGNRVAPLPPTHDMFTDVRKLERLDTWRCAQELAYQAYLLTRSEEHTSELQSHSDLVCRLLLEKKKPYSMQ